MSKPEHNEPDNGDFEPTTLDRFLKAAFTPAPGATSHVSVLRTLEPMGRSRQIRLRELAADECPPQAPRTTTQILPRRVGRYELLGEIARGGLGIVLEGRDVDLGREVAVKMLVEEHSGSAAMTRRLLEEAQIGGQLQHPGIVPVYDVGLSDDMRPYFCMKLVRGRTLAELLAARKEPTEDRMRWLSVLEQVCHSVAYAQARGVVHRDLKPGNVMVGTFGEVQVVDWGLAKRLDDATAQASGDDLATAATEASYLAGTPAYMAPEQARGEQVSIDERTDVFGLGAILCEILTGRPPFQAGSSEAIRQQAASGSLGPALAALAGSEADAELLDLARACLAPDRRDRPPGAAAVAATIAGYRSSVEARARRAELAAADARAEAAEHRSRALENEEAAARERQRRRRVVLVSVAVGVVMVVGVAMAVAMRNAERARTDRAMVEIGHGLELMVKDQYDLAAAVFRRLVEQQPDFVQAHLALGRVLTLRRDWPAAETALRRALEVAREPAVLAMLAVVLREQNRLDESAALLEEGLRTAPDNGEILAGLGMTRCRQGRLDEALSYLQRMASAAPEIALFQVEIARVHKLRGDQEACERALRQALRLDANRQSAHAGLVEFEARKGNLEAALGHARRAVELAPNDIGSRNNLAAILYNTRHCDAAIEVARGTIERDAKSGRAWHLLGAALESGNRFAEAADAYRHAVELGVAEARDPLRDCDLVVSLGKRLPALLAGTDQPKEAQEAMAVARFCKARSDLEAAARFYEAAFATGEVETDLQNHPFHHAAQAAVHCGFGSLSSPDIPESREASHWRQRAVEWLQIELRALEAIVRRGDAAEVELVQALLRRLRSDPELAVLRDRVRVARLSEAERTAIQALWDRVDELLADKKH